MHLLGAQRLARLQSNKRAYDHYQKHKQLFLEFARSVLAFAQQYPELYNDETRVNLVAAYILTLDKEIWSLATASLPASELAEDYARFVVGHEDGKI
jgi:hypothetical protein